MGRFKRRFGSGLIVLIGLLCGLNVYAESPVWAIRGARNTVYLAGSVHLLRPKDSKLPAAFDRAYSDSSQLVMEIDMDDLNPLEAQSWMITNGMYTEEGGGSLSAALGKARFQKVEKEAERLGLPSEAIDRFEPWMAAMTLVQLQLATLGFDPEQGVEKQLVRRAVSDHKQITGFETLEEQLGLLDKLPAADQMKFVDVTLEEMHEMEGATDDLVAAWRTGNANKLAALLGDEYNTAPGLYTTLVADRNRRWMPQIERMLSGDKNYMIVVGTLHLVGKGGLLELTKARGYQAKQLQ